MRRRERGQRQDEIVAGNVDRTGPGPNPVWVSVLGVDSEGDFFESIVDERITEAIAAIAEEYRTAVVLSDLERLPYAEIAELMEVPVGTVKSRLFRGRRQLQRAIRVRGRDGIHRGAHRHRRIMTGGTDVDP